VGFSRPSEQATAASSNGMRMHSGANIFGDVGLGRGAACEPGASSVSGEGNLLSRMWQSFLSLVNLGVSAAEKTRARMEWEIQKLKDEFPKIEKMLVQAQTDEQMALKTVGRIQGEIDKVKEQGRQATALPDDHPKKAQWINELKMKGAELTGQLAEAKADYETAKGDYTKAEESLAAVKDKLSDTIKQLQKAQTQAGRGDQKAKIAKTLQDAELFGQGRVADMVRQAEERAVKGDVALNRAMDQSGALRDHELKQAALKEQASGFEFN